MNNLFDPAMLDAVKKLQLKDGDLLVVPGSFHPEVARQFMSAIKYLTEPGARVALVTGDISTYNVFSDQLPKRIYETLDVEAISPISLNGKPLGNHEIVNRLNYLEASKDELHRMLMELDEFCSKYAPAYEESSYVSNGIGHKVFMTLQRTFF